jgi:hypothetical protein
MPSHTFTTPQLASIIIGTFTGGGLVGYLCCLASEFHGHSRRGDEAGAESKTPVASKE